VGRGDSLELVGAKTMLADAYFCSYFLIAQMHKRGVDVLFEQHGARLTDFSSWPEARRPRSSGELEEAGAT
jgi:hypothetical protein